MTLRDEIDKVIAAEQPRSVWINRRMYKKLLTELSQIEGAFTDVLIKYNGVTIYSNPGLSDDVITVLKRHPRLNDSLDNMSSVNYRCRSNA